MLCRRANGAARLALATSSTSITSHPQTTGSASGGGSGMFSATHTFLGGGATKKSASAVTHKKGAASLAQLVDGAAIPNVSTDGMQPEVAFAIGVLRSVTGAHLESVVEFPALSDFVNNNPVSDLAERITVAKVGARSQVTYRLFEYTFARRVTPSALQAEIAAAVGRKTIPSAQTMLVELLTTIARRQGTSEAAAVSMTEANKVIGAVKKPAAIAKAQAMTVETQEQRDLCDEILRRGYILLDQCFRAVFDDALTGARRLLDTKNPSSKEVIAYTDASRTQIVACIEALGRLVGEKRTGATDQLRSRIQQSFTRPFGELCNVLSPLSEAATSHHDVLHALFYGTVSSADVIHQLTVSLEPVDRSLYLLSLSALLNGSGIKNPVTTVDQIPPILDSLIRSGIAASYLVKSPFIATMAPEKVRAFITAATALCSSMAGNRLVPKHPIAKKDDLGEEVEEEADESQPTASLPLVSSERGNALNNFRAQTTEDDIDSAVAASAARSATSEVLFPPFANEVLITVRKLYSVKTTLGKQSADVRHLTPLTRDQRLELTANMMLHGHMSEANLLTATHVAVMRYQLRERQNTSKELPMAHYFTETVQSLIQLEEKVCAAIAVAKASVASTGDNTHADKARRMAAEIEVRRTREMCRMGLSAAMGTYTSFLTELTTKLLFLSKEQSTKSEAHDQMRLVYDALRPFATRLVAVAMIADSNRNQNSTIPTFGTLVASLQTTCPTLVAEDRSGGLTEEGTASPKMDAAVLGWASHAISQLNSDVLQSVSTVASGEATEGFHKQGRTCSALEKELLNYHTPTLNVKGSTRAIVREFSTGGILRPLLFYILEQSSALGDAGLKSTDAIAKALSRVGSGGVASLDVRTEDDPYGSSIVSPTAEVVVEVAANLTTSVTMQVLNAYNFAAHFTAEPAWEDAASRWLSRFDEDTLQHLVREFARLERYVPADSERALQCHWRHILIKAMLRKWSVASSPTTPDGIVARALALHDVAFLLVGDASGSVSIRPSPDVPNAVVACATHLQQLLGAARSMPKGASEHATVVLQALSTALVQLAKVPRSAVSQQHTDEALHSCLVALLPSATKSSPLAAFRSHREVLAFLSHLRDAATGTGSSAWLAGPTAAVVGAFTGAADTKGTAAALTPGEVIHLLDASTTAYLQPALAMSRGGGDMPVMPLETRRMCLQLVTQRLLPAQPIESYTVAESLAIVRALCAVYNSTRLAAQSSPHDEASLVSTAAACSKIARLVNMIVTKALVDRPVATDAVASDRTSGHVPLKSWEVSAAVATVALYFPTEVIDISPEVAATSAAPVMGVEEIRGMRQQALRKFVSFLLHTKVNLSPHDVMLSLYSLVVGGVYHATCIGGLLQRVTDLKGQFDISSTLALVECGTLAERMAEGNRTTISTQSGVDPAKLGATAVTSVQASGAMRKAQAMASHGTRGTPSVTTTTSGTGIEFNTDTMGLISLSTSSAQSIQRACYANASTMLRLCVQSLLETNPDLLLSASGKGSSAAATDGPRGSFHITPYFRSVLLSRSRLANDDMSVDSHLTPAETLAQRIFAPVDDAVSSAATIATGAALQFHERRQRGSALVATQVHALFHRQRVQTDVSGLRIVHAILKACPVDLVADTTLDVIAGRINEITSVELLKEVLRLLRAKGSSDPRTLEILTTFTAKLISSPSWAVAATEGSRGGPQLTCVPIGDALELAHLLLQTGARRDDIVTLLSRRLRAKTGATLPPRPHATAASSIPERELHKLDAAGTVALVNLFKETQRDELGDLIKVVLVERLPDTLPATTSALTSLEEPQSYSRTTAVCLATLCGAIHTFVSDADAKGTVLRQLLAFASGLSGPHRQSFVPLLDYNQIRTMMLAVEDSNLLKGTDAHVAKVFIHQCIREVLRRFHGERFDRQWAPDAVEETDGRYCARVFEGFAANARDGPSKPNVQQTGDGSSRSSQSKKSRDADAKAEKNSIKIRLRPTDFLKKQRLDHAVEASGSLPDIGMATMLLCQLLRLRVGERVIATATLSSSATKSAENLLRNMPAPPQDTEVVSAGSLALVAATLAAAGGDASLANNQSLTSVGIGGAFLVASDEFGPGASTVEAALERDGATCVRVLLSHVYRYRQAMLSRLTLLDRLRSTIRGTIQYKGEISVNATGSQGKAKIFHKKAASPPPPSTIGDSTAPSALAERRTSGLATVLSAEKQSYVEVLHPQLFEVVLLSTVSQ